MLYVAVAVILSFRIRSVRDIGRGGCDVFNADGFFSRLFETSSLLLGQLAIITYALSHDSCVNVLQPNNGAAGYFTTNFFLSDIFLPAKPRPKRRVDELRQ